MEKIYIAPTNLLVEKINDYYKKSNDFTTEESVDYEIGIIAKVGDDILPEWVDKIVYYRRDLSEKINLKKIGKYELLTESVVLIVRLDQDKFNY